MADHDEHDAHDAHGATVDRRDLVRIACTALAAALVWLRVWEPFPHVSVIGVLGTLIGGWPIFHEAWESIRERRMTMELSMTIALVAALVIGEFFTALMIATFVLVAEVLEGLTVGRGRRAIRDLLDFLPATVTIRRDGGAVRIASSLVKIGDAVLVAPGERVPADGSVRAGHSYIDQSTITGESAPVEKTPGSPVYAGTINQSGALEIVAERLGRDTSFGKIIEAVERAERSQAPVQRTADRYAGYLVYFALVCAVLTFALTRDGRSTISVIIVAGACGIAAGTPLAILGAIGRAARAGAIIKGGRHLEALWNVDVVALDKTGTVTFGTPAVCALRPADGVSEATLLGTAAIAERRSEHPLAKAVVQAADALDLRPAEPTAFTYLPGRGIVAQAYGDEIVVGSRAFARERGIESGPVAATAPRAASEIVVARNGRMLGTIFVADTVRPEARESVQDLRHMGIRTVLLTGDMRSVSESVAKDLNVDDVRSELLPDDKVAFVRALAAGGNTVVMIGDGINDAPALVEATVGVAMGSGTDVARESAGIVLLGNDLSKFTETVRISRRARDIIRFNFAGTIAVDAVGVGLAAFGLLSPLLAAFIHVASELTFILNSARLLPARSKSPVASAPIPHATAAPAA
jgi:Cd2+/Zn2+-exporting ATPase/Cu+-exporting ATPase